MNRGEFLRKAGQITLGSILVPVPLPGCLASLWGTSPVRPNILLILTDDQHYHSLEEMAGNPLDPMAKTKARLGPGLTFNNSFVQTPLCAPSRTSTMTGKRVGIPEEPDKQTIGHGIPTNWNAARRFRNHGYQRNEIGYWLKNEAGYQTAYRGKFLNGYERIATWEPPGYDDVVLTLGNRDPIIWNRNGTTRKSAYARKTEAATLGNLTETFIANADDTRPWFCFLSVNAPHSPYDPSNLHKDDYNNVAFPARPNFDHHDPLKPSFVRDNPPLSDAEKIEARDTWRGKMEELMDVDDVIDSICTGIDFTNTYVFFTSDNGYMFGEHRLRSKGHPYEESIRVPLLVRGPGMRENATTDLIAANIDIAPTILELAGLDPAEKACDGRSLVAPMFDETLPVEDWRDALFIEYRSELVEDAGHWRAMRTQDSIYIERQNGQHEFYNLAEDPYQLSNAYTAQDPVALYEMSSRLSEMNTASGDCFRAAETPTTV